MNEDSKRVVVTGASSGFGEGAVKAFADKGYRVWGTMRDVDGRNASKRQALEACSPDADLMQALHAFPPP